MRLNSPDSSRSALQLSSRLRRQGMLWCSLILVALLLRQWMYEAVPDSEQINVAMNDVSSSNTPVVDAPPASDMPLVNSPVSAHTPDLAARDAPALPKQDPSAPPEDDDGAAAAVVPQIVPPSPETMRTVANCSVYANVHLMCDPQSNTSDNQAHTCSFRDICLNKKPGSSMATWVVFGKQCCECSRPLKARPHNRDELGDWCVHQGITCRCLHCSLTTAECRSDS